MKPDPKRIQRVLQYHEETRHHFYRHARSPGYMDWDNQPNPFRFYQGCQRMEMPFLQQDPEAKRMSLYRRDTHSPDPLSLELVAGILELSLALSAWKAIPGQQWSLRMNPSSGNLHPTEAHLILFAMEDIDSGVYHYSPLYHALEKRVQLPDSLVSRLKSHLGVDAFFIGLSTIFWRESWKYGERAFRYCNLDTGHALACVSMAANLFGWTIRRVETLSDKSIQTLLGFDQVAWHPLEAEYPQILCLVHPNDCHPKSRQIPNEMVEDFSRLNFLGTPNRLSQDPVKWDIIYQVAEDVEKPETCPSSMAHVRGDFSYPDDRSPVSAAAVIRKRRSAVAFDPDHTIDRQSLVSILDKTIPVSESAPFDSGALTPRIDLILFVHRVTDLEPGLYFLQRTQDGIQRAKSLASDQFLWEPMDSAIGLYLMMPGNFQKMAAAIGCHQEIAGSGVFSLAMMGWMANALALGPWHYRYLFWEAGMIGQVLYLEAEIHGIRGTGIGCYYDNAIADLLELTDTSWQSMYHFTLGYPVEDQRLTTKPPYVHLSRNTRIP